MHTQVIVQASPHVVGSLLPIAEFTSPMYYPFHQEQFSAGDTAEDFAIFLVVQEQVFVGMRPAPPSETWLPLDPSSCLRSWVVATPWTTPPSRSCWRSRCSKRHELEEMVAAAKRREEVRLLRRGEGSAGGASMLKNRCTRLTTLPSSLSSSGWRTWTILCW